MKRRIFYGLVACCVALSSILAVQAVWPNALYFDQGEKLENGWHTAGPFFIYVDAPDVTQNLLDRISRQPEELQMDDVPVYVCSKTNSVCDAAYGVIEGSDMPTFESVAGFENLHGVFLNADSSRYTMDRTLTHELAHAYDRRHKISSGEAWLQLYSASPDLFGSYGSTNELEYFAEAVTSYFRDSRLGISQEKQAVFDYLDTVF